MNVSGLQPAAWVLYALLAISLPIAVVTDVRSRKIYDVLTFPTIGVALLSRLLLTGWDGKLGLAAGLVGALAGGVPFALAARYSSGMGMGDAKLVAAVGAVLGWPLVLAALAFIALSGGLQGLLTAIWTGAFFRTLKNTGVMLLRLVHLSRSDVPRTERQYVPYGVAIAAGTVWTVLWDLSNGAGS